MAFVERISRRISAITESATLAVDAKAKALKAGGEDVIGFGAGEPDFPTPVHIVEAAVAACRNVAAHKYTPAGGLPELKDAIVAKTKRDSGLVCTPANVLVSNGGKHSLFNAFATLLDEGDEVLLPAPYWTSYPEMIKIAGGVPVAIATTKDSGFRVTIEQLQQARTPRTKLVVFVSPSNPTGAVYPPAEVEAIGRWAVDNGLWVLTDEIYEHLTFGEHRFSSLPVLVPEITDRCVISNGVAKTYAMTGWRVGWTIAPVDVTRAATNLQSHSTSNVNNVAQWAAVAALQGDLSAVAEMRTAYERRGHLMYEMLAAIDGVEVLEPQGAFYCFPSFERVLGREFGGRTASDTLGLCEIILEQAKVALVPGEAFGAPGYARLSYALGDDDLIEGVKRIAKLLS